MPRLLALHSLIGPPLGAVSALADGAGRLGGQARWGAGLALAAHAHLIGSISAEHVSQRGSIRRDPPSLDRWVPGTPSALQPASHGVGPLYLRRYRVRIDGCALGPDRVMARLKADLNAAAPPTMVSFRRITRRRAADMRLGDEYAVDLFGPWVCRVRVIDCRPGSFRLATLRGHMEAGEIRFSCRRSSGGLVFTVESRARCADRIFELLYDRVPVAREMQAHLWSSFCVRVAALAEGRVEGPVSILTRRDDRPV